MSLKHQLKNIIRNIGYDISQFNPTTNYISRRKKLLVSYEIDVLLDVGANNGQFSQEMRKDLGFQGKIISFEPLSTAFNQLSHNAAKDPNWQVFNYALGQEDKMTMINISKNSESSSLLNILSTHVKTAPDSKYVSTEMIEIKRLDSIINEIYTEKDNIYLKIDTQGYEREVLIGAEQSLTFINTIQLEMSLVPLYEGQLLFGEMHDNLLKKDYCLVSIETGFTDENSGQLLQLDGIYHRF